MGGTSCKRGTKGVLVVREVIPSTKVDKTVSVLEQVEKMALNNATPGNCSYDEERTQPEVDKAAMKEVMRELLLELPAFRTALAEGGKGKGKEKAQDGVAVAQRTSGKFG